MVQTIEFQHNGLYYRADIDVQFNENGESIAINFADYALPENEIEAPVLPEWIVPYKIYEYMKDKRQNQFMPPYDIDFSNFGFHKKRTLVKWEVTKIGHYAEYDGVTYDNLIVEETNTYTRNPVTGYVQYRDKSIVWFNENWNPSEPKVSRKYYNNAEAIDEGEIRRNNIINETKINAITAILITEFGGNPASFVTAENIWKSFVTDVTLEIQQYKDWIRQPLHTAIANATYDWMDNVIPAWYLWSTTETPLTVRQFVDLSITY